jgi:hypothetical protein
MKRLWRRSQLILVLAFDGVAAMDVREEWQKAGMALCLVLAVAARENPALSASASNALA